MTVPAAMLAPAERTYRGAITDPDRWATWVPHKGDVLICTPAKCGTTWTQTILAMLIHGGTELPAKLPVLSPWVDADLGVPAYEVAAALATQTGRRVLKTHIPADGFPIWEGVTVISVYRHPLDMFFSLRKHMANMADPGEDNPMLWPVPQAIRAFVNGATAVNDFEQDNLENVADHYARTVLSGRLPSLKLFHYSEMIQDGRRTVQALAKAAAISADGDLINEVTEATAFGAMKANASDYAPVGGTGFWKSDESFFDSGTSGKWQGNLTHAELDLYRQRLTELIPDRSARDWLESGGS